MHRLPQPEHVVALEVALVDPLPLHPPLVQLGGPLVAELTVERDPEVVSDRRYHPPAETEDPAVEVPEREHEPTTHVPEVSLLAGIGGVRVEHSRRTKPDLVGPKRLYVQASTVWWGCRQVTPRRFPLHAVEQAEVKEGRYLLQSFLGEAHAITSRSSFGCVPDSRVMRRRSPSRCR
jgi:hypothetical protein